eukprot:12795893-Heterocapsa_arctica.AAC.1
MKRVTSVPLGRKRMTTVEPSSETSDRPPTFTAPGGIVTSSPTSRRAIGSSSTHIPAAFANR